MNRKGDIFSSYMLIFILVGILLVGIFAFFIISLIAPPVVGSLDTIGGAVQQASGGNAELSQDINNTVVPIIQATHSIEWIGYGAMVFFFLGYFIMLFYVRSYPFLIFVWIVLVLVLVLLSIYLSNSYQNIATQNIGSVGYDSYQTNNYILSNLPIITGVIGLLGAVVLFVLVSRDTETDGGF